VNKTKWLRIINILLFSAVLWQGVSGLGRLFLGYEFLEDELFTIIHAGGGISLLVLATIHLILNWGWVRSNYFGKHSKKGGTL